MNRWPQRVQLSSLLKPSVPVSSLRTSKIPLSHTGHHERNGLSSVTRLSDAWSTYRNGLLTLTPVLGAGFRLASQSSSRQLCCWQKSSDDAHDRPQAQSPVQNPIARLTPRDTARRVSGSLWIIAYSETTPGITRRS